ncbi:MAG: hypothetical protein NO483_01925 [Candidatus Methanomethylicia archaeon]|nr:hypothetical protein [Candidatus Methanomethylicia archaeon]
MKQLYSNKGVSTIIGSMIFLSIFILSITAIIIWTQNYVNYAENIREELEFMIEKSREDLIINSINSSGKLTLAINNPTSQTIILKQIWANHSFQLGEWIIPANSLVYINTTLDYVNTSKVVTSKGNIFSVIPKLEGIEEGIVKKGKWYVQWYNLSARRVFDKNIGESYWYDLCISFDWAPSITDPVCGPYTKVGFNATTRIIALSSKIYINWYVGEECRIIVKEIGYDSDWQDNSGYVELNVTQNATYTITILYSRWIGRAFLTLNIVNADFAT